MPGFIRQGACHALNVFCVFKLAQQREILASPCKVGRNQLNIGGHFYLDSEQVTARYLCNCLNRALVTVLHLLFFFCVCNICKSSSAVINLFFNAAECLKTLLAPFLLLFFFLKKCLKKIK